jgi:hypothetical protein
MRYVEGALKISLIEVKWLERCNKNGLWTGGMLVDMSFGSRILC